MSQTAYEPVFRYEREQIVRFDSGQYAVELRPMYWFPSRRLIISWNGFPSAWPFATAPFFPCDPTRLSANSVAYWLALFRVQGLYVLAQIGDRAVECFRVQDNIERLAVANQVDEAQAWNARARLLESQLSVDLANVQK